MAGWFVGRALDGWLIVGVEVGDAGVCGVVCAAATEKAKQSIKRRIIILFAPLYRTRQSLRTGQVHRCGGAKQHCRYAILRPTLRARVATNTSALFAAPQPEPSLLFAHNRTRIAEQRKADWLVGWRLDKERTVGLHGCGAGDYRSTLRI